MRALTLGRGRSPHSLLGAAFLTLTNLTPTYSQTVATFGRITEAIVPSGGLAANYKRASRFTLPGPGTVKRLCAYLDGKGGGSGFQRTRLALYDDNNGVPGRQMFETSEWTIQSGSSAGWTCSAGYAFPLHPVPAGAYWIVLHTSAPGGIIRNYGDGAAANWYGNADAFEDGASATFGGGASGAGTMSMYAEYYADSQLRNAGRTTIGAYPSGGMSANFKRGSSFNLPERGKLYAMSAYLDGGGTAPALEQQNLRYVIYRDAGGVPGARIFQSPGTGFRSSWPGLWISDYAFQPTAPTLDAGRYWFAIHTDVTGGATRNFGDGTSGNWCGNADAFADGAAAPFGPCTTGNGTISAFVSYRPGTITTGQVGRTDVGTKPSGGLSSNFIRYSSFYTPDFNATLTGLYAYLDGRGATSGSQNVRMVIYGYHLDPHLEYVYKITESEEVAIPAGMPPRWVRFSVPAMSLNSNVGTYYLGIHTGDAARVARDYWDGRPAPDRSWFGSDNWFGTVDGFNDGATGNLGENPTTKGQGTLSVYATYSLAQP